MADINKILGQTICSLRAERGWSQEELANRANVHRTYISQLERGLKSPTLSVLAGIAKALNVKLSTLLSLME